MVKMITKLLAPLSRRVRLTVGRCLLTLVDDALPLQKVQITILDGEVHDQVERLQNFGFSAVPLAGARGVTLSVGGDRAHQVIVAVDDGRHRPKSMQPGESAMYNSHGVTLKFLADGSAVLVCTQLQVQGDIIATGQISDAAGSMAMMRTIFNTHPHAVSGTVAVPPVKGM